MIKSKAMLAIVLGSAIFAAQPAAAEPLGTTWADVTKLPDFFTGNWQSVTSFLDNPVEGGLTIEVSHEPPEDSAAGNWLPAPAGEFYLMMRLYRPRAPALDGTWQPPAVTMQR